MYTGWLAAFDAVAAWGTKQATISNLMSHCTCIKRKCKPYFRRMRSHYAQTWNEWRYSRNRKQPTPCSIKRETPYTQGDISVQEAQLSPRDRALRRISWSLANCHATMQKLLVRQVLNQVSAVANWPAQQNRAADSAWRAINYSGRPSELGGIIDFVDRRRPSLSRSERPPFLS